MKPLLFFIITVIIYSCNVNSKTDSGQSLTDTLIHKTLIVSDSLDTDTSDNYITSSFPKNINDTLYRSLNNLWSFVIDSYKYNAKLDSTFSFQNLNSELLANGYSSDTISNLKIEYRYRSFNKRLSLIISDISNMNFKCLLQEMFWFNQKKYAVQIEITLKVTKPNSERLFDFTRLY